MRLAWTVWTPTDWCGTIDHAGVVVYAETRGKARWLGAAEMDVDEGVLELRVLRAPKADHLAESRKQPDWELMRDLGFWAGEPGTWEPAL